jgi:hypothetical protein
VLDRLFFHSTDDGLDGDISKSHALSHSSTEKPAAAVVEAMIEAASCVSLDLLRYLMASNRHLPVSQASGVNQPPVTRWISAIRQNPGAPIGQGTVLSISLTGCGVERLQMRPKG